MSISLKQWSIWRPLYLVWLILPADFLKTVYLASTMKGLFAPLKFSLPTPQPLTKSQRLFKMMTFTEFCRAKVQTGREGWALHRNHNYENKTVMQGCEYWTGKSECEQKRKGKSGLFQRSRHLADSPRADTGTGPLLRTVLVEVYPCLHHHPLLGL